METDLSPEKIAFYRENGFVVLEKFLEPAELERWRTVTEEGMRARIAADQGAANVLNNQGDPETFYSQVFTQCIQISLVHPPMAELIYDERIGRVAGELAGVDGIRVWHDQALVKGPYANHTAFHFDNPFWSFFSKDALSIWVALDDATLENGCLWYLPGTHKEATFNYAAIGSNLGDLFKTYPQWKKIAARPAVCPAGGAVFHNGLIAHGAGVNMTPRYRRAMTCGFMPDGSTFNGQRNILTEDEFNALTVGEVLKDDVRNPLIWQRAG
jgi:ectoine hydroxylase-related dioxygenase (phytanoyl-CoA dioxygenase family)